MAEKAIFLDRDDTLIEDPGYINDPDQVKLLDGVPEALVELRAMGYKLVVISNQSAIARGMVTEKVLDKIHERMKQLLVKKGAYLDGIYYCPYHPKGSVEEYNRESELRKPGPGMLLQAVQDMDIALGDSWVIGDSGRDIEAGIKAGCRTILIDNPLRSRERDLWGPKPDFRAVNIKEAVNIVKQYHRTVTAAPDRNQTAIPDEIPAIPEISEEPQQPDEPSPEQNRSDNDESLLKDILEQLKKNNRHAMFDEFSTMRLLAGITQIVVLFCLLISIWMLLNPERENDSVFIALGFAVVLQLMTLTFYVIRQRK